MKENQINRIDHFLKFISEISKSGIQIDSNLVYANLVKLGSKGSRFDDYFTAWVQRFKTNKNINVFVDDNWNCFCQFKSIYDDKNPYYKLKLYIPMDKEHIYKGVNDLFDFLSHQNIQHLSKVTINERFDDVVIRVNNVRCAKEIMKYVNQNDYIKQGLIAPNPFAFTDGNISLVWDGMMSYNSVISNWISLYINQCKINNSLDNVSYIDFYTYVYNMYNKIFIEGKDINNFLNSLKLNGGIKELTNYQYVTRILLISLNKNSTLDDLFNEFNKIVIPINQKNTENKMNYFIENDKKQDILIDNTQEESFNLLLFELSKNSGIENAILCIKRFNETGDYRYFTRKNNIRNTLLSNNITKDVMNQLFINFQKYILINVSKLTYEKYGPIQLSRALFALKNNNYMYFTNENNLRKYLELLINNNNIDNIIHDILIESGYNISQNDDDYWIFSEMVSNSKKK